MQTRRAIVQLLKTEGALDSTSLGRRLKLTPMAVRQHLYALQDEKLVTSEDRPVPRGVLPRGMQTWLMVAITQL